MINAECTFDRNSCNWRNTSTSDFEWTLATLGRRPSNLPDKTFGAPVGYAYFDIFNVGGSRSNSVKMISPKVDGTGDSMCFSFWFAAFGAGETTSLKIVRVDGEYPKEGDKGKQGVLHSIRQGNMTSSNVL